ncbi:MAG: redox-regulated ATPase YchF [bacterium]|nr:redox-regulated ATPase YchF [bacterium]
MRIAIIGFQTSGKTTIFNALTGQQAETSAFVTGRVATNQAVVKVPDPRLDKLTALFKPKKHTPATVEYIDLAGIARAEGSAGEGLGEKQLNEIATADALLAVVRGFADAAGAPPDPSADIEAIALEMVLSDLKKVDNRIERIDKQIHKAPAKEKEALAAELEGVRKLKEALEEGRPARTVELTPDQLRAVRGFQLLTIKPTMFLVNEGEAEWAAHHGQSVDLGPLAAVPHTMGERLCGLTEMEIAQLAGDERAEFLATYGIEEPAAHRIIRLCYALLGRISFLTVGPDECRAWTIERETTAPQAAGAIHSDLERGFIRAEVIGWRELLELGSYAEARKHGKLRVEGKHYIVQDGDVINILFSV